MSLNGVGGIPATILRPQEAVRPRVEQERTPGAAATQAQTIAKATTTGLLAPRHEGLPAEAPEGTDPDLWQVLTPQERAYFAKMTAMGPLTYGAASRSSAPGETPLARGGRLDVRA
jgi:hypothetical protein